jgi:hypothetical protein
VALVITSLQKINAVFDPNDVDTIGDSHQIDVPNQNEQT